MGGQRHKYLYERRQGKPSRLQTVTNASDIMTGPELFAHLQKYITILTADPFQLTTPEADTRIPSFLHTAARELLDALLVNIPRSSASALAGVEAAARRVFDPLTQEQRTEVASYVAQGPFESLVDLAYPKAENDTKKKVTNNKKASDKSEKSIVSEDSDKSEKSATSKDFDVRLAEAAAQLRLKLDNIRSSSDKYAAWADLAEEELGAIEEEHKEAAESEVESTLARLKLGASSYRDGRARAHALATYNGEPSPSAARITSLRAKRLPNKTSRLMERAVETFVDLIDDESVPDEKLPSDRRMDRFIWDCFLANQTVAQIAEGAVMLLGDWDPELDAEVPEYIEMLASWTTIVAAYLDNTDSWNRPSRKTRRFREVLGELAYYEEEDGEDTEAEESDGEEDEESDDENDEKSGEKSKEVGETF